MRSWQCPKCEILVHPAATVCPGCRVDLAICAWCRDLTSLNVAEPARGTHRPRIKCDRCAKMGARCRTGSLGGYCNNLARVEGKFGKQLCAVCTHSLFDAGKTVAAWTLIGLVGSKLRPRR